jgi:8-oxo-dGTP diphosphatase
MAKWEPKTPFLAADGIIKLFDENKNLQGIVFIERLNEPFGIALPGGFVDRGEKVEDALVRDMKEEVTLDVTIKKLLGVYSDPSRDKRLHCASCVYICNAIGVPKAADDAKKVFIYKKDEIPLDKLVFDHRKIVEDFLKQEQI